MAVHLCPAGSHPLNHRLPGGSHRPRPSGEPGHRQRGPLSDGGSRGAPLTPCGAL